MTKPPWRALARADAVMCALIAPDAMPYGIAVAVDNAMEDGAGGAVVVLGEGWAVSSSARAAAATAIPAAEEERWRLTPNRPARRRSLAIRAATACLSTTPRRWKIRSRAFASATRCSSIFRTACKPGQERNIEVDLTADARGRYRDAEVRYRRTSMSSNGSGTGDAAPTKITRAPSDRGYSTPSTSSTDSGNPAVHRRRAAVNEDGSPIAVPSADEPPPASPPNQ